MRRSTLRSVLLAFSLVLVSMSPASGAGTPGALDPTFGTGGIVTTDFGNGFDFVRAFALLPDGTAVVGGYSEGFAALSAFDTAGALDRSFGVDGTVDTGLGGLVKALAVQPDGKLVAAVSEYYRGLTARYLPDGSLDPTFGRDGIAKGLGRRGAASAVAVLPDGRIVLAGTRDQAFALAALLPDGSRDPSFGTDGRVVTTLGGRADLDAIASLGDGTVVAAGVARADDGKAFAMARYLGDGSLDPSFGHDGVVTTSACGGASLAHAIAVEGTGRLLLAGSCEARERIAIARYTPDGALDPRFGDGGVVVTDVGSKSEDIAFSVALDGSGRILVAGGARRYESYALTTRWVVARYLKDGSPDPTFGDGGVVQLPLGVGDEGARAVTAQADGSLLVAGSTESDAADMALVRLDEDGALDPAFGVDGVATADVVGRPDGAYAVVVQSDGKIVAAGWASCSKFGLARYDSSGALDPTFGDGGRVVTDTELVAVAAALVPMPDGRLIAVGSGDGPCSVSNALEMARYLPDGSLDPTFGDGGIVVTSPGSVYAYSASAAVLRDDGTLIVGGTDEPGFTLEAFLPDGTPDPSFGGDGIVRTPFPEGMLLALALQADGRVVAAGWSTNGFVLARYEQDGALDPAFGDGGVVATTFSKGLHGASALTIQPDGKIVAAGRAGNEWRCSVALARYQPDGSLDPTFGGDGTVRTNIGEGCDRASEVRIQPDGKIVVAGGAGISNEEDVVVLRYLSDGALDPAFGVDGIAHGPATPDFEWAYGLALQADGGIVTAGLGSEPSDFLLMRFEG